jgi:tetratricopeptide (TPR) repeat protein
MFACAADTGYADAALGEQLLWRLDGLPLAIAQAGAYLQESGVDVETYLFLYDQQWDNLMAAENEDKASLQDYPDRSVWTTWIISYVAICEKHEATANLLLLWSYLDNKDLWYELFEAACQASETARTMLFETIGDIANNKVKFYDAMVRLRNFSLAESIPDTRSYATHPVVHNWAFYYGGKQRAIELYRLAVVIVGLAIPEDTPYFSSALGRRLLPHVQSCNRRTVKCKQKWALRVNLERENSSQENEKKTAFLTAFYLMGILYKNQGKPVEAKQMYKQALQGQEKLLGPTHELTLITVNDLAEAESMYDWARRGQEERLGPDHRSTLQTINNLAILHADQDKLADAQQMFKQVLLRKEKALGQSNISTFNTYKNLAAIFARQGRLAEAEQHFEHALQGFARYICMECVRYYLPTLDVLENLGDINREQGKHYKACTMYLRALYGLQGHLDQSHRRYEQLVDKFVCAADQHIRGQEYIPSFGV